MTAVIYINAFTVVTIIMVLSTIIVTTVHIIAVREHRTVCSVWVAYGKQVMLKHASRASCANYQRVYFRGKVKRAIDK